MTTPKALILRAAGTNCDQETKFACEKAGFQADVLHVNRLVEDRRWVKDYHFMVLPGGFSYGDDLGAGKVLAHELRAKLMPEFRTFVKEGKLILGICNGFQVLAKAGLLPDPFDDDSSQLTLANNDSGMFVDHPTKGNVTRRISPRRRMEARLPPSWGISGASGSRWTNLKRQVMMTTGCGGADHGREGYCPPGNRRAPG